METYKEPILVTGSSGHIASALIGRLASRYNVIGLDFAGPPAAPASATSWNDRHSGTARTASAAISCS